MTDRFIVLCVRSGDQTCYFSVGCFSLCRSWTWLKDEAWRFPSLAAAEQWEGVLHAWLSSPGTVLYPLPDRQPFSFGKKFRIEYELVCSAPNVLK